MNAKDPVYAVKLTVFVRDSLQQCQQVFGEQNFQAMMASVESSVIDKLQSFVQSERYAVPLYPILISYQSVISIGNGKYSVESHSCFLAVLFQVTMRTNCDKRRRK